MAVQEISYGQLLDWFYDKDRGVYFAKATHDGNYNVEYVVHEEDGLWDWDLEHDLTKEYEWVGTTGWSSLEDAISDCESHHLLHFIPKTEMFKHLIEHEIKAQENIMEMSQKAETAENSLKYWMAQNAKSALESVFKDIGDIDSGKLSKRQKTMLMTALSLVKNGDK